MSDIQFYQNQVCLNVLTNSLENAQSIVRAAEGCVVVGLLSKNYADTVSAIEDMQRYQTVLNNRISVGLGAGDAKQWKAVAAISRVLQPQHINQVFSAVGYTRGVLQNEVPWINTLVSPTGTAGLVKISTGWLSENQPPAIIPVRTAIAMSKEMGGNALKFFPMKGLACKEELIEVAKACAELDFALEPTGGIDLSNFEEILQIIVEAKVKKIIPHVYSSIIDPVTKETRIEDVQCLMHLVKKVLSR